MEEFFSILKILFYFCILIFFIIYIIQSNKLFKYLNKIKKIDDLKYLGMIDENFKKISTINNPVKVYKYLMTESDDEKLNFMKKNCL